MTNSSARIVRRSRRPDGPDGPTALRRYGLGARLLFELLNIVYDKPRSLSKFKVLELVARVPYQSWEQVAHIAITHTSNRPDFARRVVERVTESRAQQDNE